MISGSLLNTLLLLVEDVIEITATSVFASYIFTYILNREPKIVFPPKLVIRHRTSAESKNLLSLGVLIGNKSRFDIHNVECTLICYYSKKNSGRTNGEYSKTYRHPIINDFFRFSFLVEDLPSRFLKNLVDKPSNSNIDRITICIAGNSGSIGNSFRLAKQYKISDIVFDEHVPEFKDIVKNPLTGKTLYKRTNWKEVMRIEEVDERTRAATVQEIRKIVKMKRKQ